MLKNKKSKIFKISLSLAVVFFATGTGIIADQLLFREIEIQIVGLQWVEEFRMRVAEITLDEPCLLVIKSKTSEDSENSEIVLKDRRLVIRKQKVKIGACTNRRILVPLRIENISEKKNKPFFFVPQFRASITGGEEQLEADFSLHLKATQCQEGQEKIKGKNFVLCNIDVSSSNVRSFSITELRKNTLAGAIKNLATNRDDYTLVLKIAPDLEVVRDISSFSISIENITPELVIVD